jgi:aminoglycoside phosphotransferase (APT) family kinase protein
MAASWERDPVSFHGDGATGNPLLHGRRLTAVIDFDTSGVGDPACDVVIAWTLLSGPSRDAFRSATWSRGRGWLWKALISLVGHLDRDPEGAAVQQRVIDRVLADRAREACGP